MNFRILIKQKILISVILELHISNSLGFQETKVIQTEASSSTEITNTENYKWSNLQPNTEYDVSYSYTLNYKGTTTEMTSTGLKIKTGVARPTISDCYYELLGDNYILHFKLEDPNNILISSMIKYDKKVERIAVNQEVVYIPVANVKDPKFTIHLVYNVNSSHAENITEIYEINELIPEPEPTPKPEETKKCGKKCAELIIANISLIAVLGIILRKRK